jgi:hypothetical protein
MPLFMCFFAASLLDVGCDPQLDKRDVNQPTPPMKSADQKGAVLTPNLRGSEPARTNDGVVGTSLRTLID